MRTNNTQARPGLLLGCGCCCCFARGWYSLRDALEMICGVEVLSVGFSLLKHSVCKGLLARQHPKLVVVGLFFRSELACVYGGTFACHRVVCSDFNQQRKRRPSRGQMYLRVVTLRVNVEAV